MTSLPHRAALPCLIASLAATSALAQGAPKLEFPRPSPKAQVSQTVGLTEVTVAYSSPAVRGRTLWGEVVPYDEPWRAGANECTQVRFSGAVSIGGKPVPAGAYCLFYLPTRAGWTFILNRNTQSWGTSDYKASDDVLRVPAVASIIPSRERLAYAIVDFDDAGGTLALEWGTTRVAVKFTTDTREKLVSQLRALKSDDWKPYNAGARYLLAANTEPVLALQLADQSIRVRETWQNDWTKAQLLFAAGKKADAIALGEKATALGKKDPQNFDGDEVARTLATWRK